MKNKILYPIAIFCAYFLTSCNQNQTGPSFPESPSRAAYEGFSWQDVSGSGLRFWAQSNGNIRIETDDNIPGAQIVWFNDSSFSARTVLQLFPLPDKNIQSLTKILAKEPGWKDIDCSFREIESGRTGVKRYVLEPSGPDAQKFKEQSSKEPIPTTCNGWGMGNSGSRYFEVHENRPDIALFVEIGQDAPLFDEQSLVITDTTKIALPDNTKQHLKGILTFGHEVRSFRPENDSLEYWIVDKTGSLSRIYDHITQGTKNGTPIEAEIIVTDAGKTDEGFAAEYDGVVHLNGIISMKRTAQKEL